MFITCAFLSSGASSAPWEGPRLSEDQLREIETPSTYRGKQDLKPNSWSAFSNSAFIYAYVEAAKVQSSTSKGLSYPVKEREKPGHDPVYSLSVLDGFTNGFQTPQHVSLVALSAGIDIISWLAKDKSAEAVMLDFQKKDFENYKSPSLWLIKIEDQNKTSDLSKIGNFADNEANIQAAFKQNEDILLSLPIGCDIAYYRSTNVFGSRGNYGVNTPGVAHERNYLCGNENLDIHLGIVMKELVHAEVNRTIDNVLAFKNSFLRLDRNASLQRILNVPEDKKNLTAAELYKKIAPSFGKEWYAIFTAPNEAGEMRVYVAKENNIIEYDLPIRPKRP